MGLDYTHCKSKRQQKKEFWENQKFVLNLCIEELEQRFVPVVGATAWNDAPIINPGEGYDGVVRIHGGLNGSGSLLSTGRHILTAAHLVDRGIANIQYDLSSRDGNLVKVQVPIFANAGGQIYQEQHPRWIADKTANKSDHGNDIAILRLTDPSSPAQNRFLVSPFGAEKYSLYNGRNEGGQFEFFGHGWPGTGAGQEKVPPPRPLRKGQNTFEIDGTQQIHEIQAIQITGNPTKGGYHLSHSGVTTGKIDFNANAGAIQNALWAATDGAGNFPLQNNVVVRGDKAGNPIVDAAGNQHFFVEFVGKLGPAGDLWNADDLAVVKNTLKDGGGVAVAAPGITERVQGGKWTWGDKNLSFDFDSNNPANDTFWLFYGSSNLGLFGKNEEAMIASGDSGGPAFLKGSKEIVGVVSTGGFDVNNLIPDWDAKSTNSSFGEMGWFARVSSYTKLDPAANRDNFLNEKLFPEITGGAKTGRYKGPFPKRGDSDP